MTSQPIIAARRWLAPAAVAAFFLYFFRLGGTPLLDPDEPVYGQIAREMVTTGRWLTPHLAGRPWFDKPPLFYWASAASMAVFGPTEFAARLPSAVAAILLALLVFFVGRRLFGAAAGWAAAAVLATSLQTIILGRAAVTDMLFALTLMAPLAAFALWYAGTGRRTGWAALCGAALGLAVMCKGPVAIVLLGLTALAFLAWERQLRRLLSVDALVALLCCLLVAGPWFGSMLLLNRTQFIDQFIKQNNLQRFAQSEHKSAPSPFYFVPVLLIGLFPWSAFLLRATAVGRREGAGRLLLVWAAVIFLFFSASKTKLVTYIYPLYPAVALLIGAALTETAAGKDEMLFDAKARNTRNDGSVFDAKARSERKREKDVRQGWEADGPAAETGGGHAAVRPFPLSFSRFRLFRAFASKDSAAFERPAAVTLGMALLMGVGLAGLAAWQYHAALPGVGVVALAIGLGSLGGLGAARRGQTPLGAYTGMMAAGAAVLAGMIVPRIAPSFSLRELATWEGETHRPLVAYHLKTPGFLYYAGRELPEESEPAALAERARATPGLAVVMSRHAFPELEAKTPDLMWRVIWRRGNRLVAEPLRREPGARAAANHSTEKMKWSARS